MRTAAIQFKATRGDVAGSRQRSVELLRQAAADADLVVLPEMALTGYVFADEDDARAVAETAQGETFEAWRTVAREAGCWIVGGFPERTPTRLYNSALVIRDDGELAFCYRKTLLYDADHTWAAPGDSGYRRFDTGRGAFGVGVCMDLNDPRFLLWVWRSRLDALAFPTNWIDEGVDVWPYWHERMQGSGAALVAANTWGEEPGCAFSGRSAILQHGQQLAGAPKEGDAVVSAAIARRRAYHPAA